MTTEKARERMLKLLALARRGEGGERDNAERFLETMLKKHGMTLSDLEEEDQPADWAEFKTKNAQDHRLFAQVASMVLKSNSFTTRQYRGKASVWLSVTKAQFLEIELHYRAFHKDLEKALELAYVAFVNRNNIFSGIKDDEDKPSQYSTSDLLAVAAMMEGMPRTSVRRALGHTTEAA